ncbi:DUF177 domain-containing protein [Hyphomicrobium sp. LHD-15]|uniref:YceD family protein n=1 Tax=Hyphomicrobium sp. LHD-15 TaxID=3072142 RepID=UPI00280CFC47|nr:DUF177 domain-containing protein [Hyphomicrobium sp. LHD-15]MDQ8698286.1 DUF177 domain-containing protein [Hyphomicrobium sp. LHD-15]
MTALRDWFKLVTDIGERPLSETREATEEERIELARELDILSCEALKATYVIKALGSGRYNFSGTLEAEVTQACVVSLEPVPGRLSESYSIELGPIEALQDETPVDGDRVVSSVPDVEPIEDGRIEVGSMIFGVLSAGLDPYPRKPGAEFEWVDPKLAADPDGASPFAALAKLKPKP